MKRPEKCNTARAISQKRQNSTIIDIQNNIYTRDETRYRAQEIRIFVFQSQLDQVLCTFNLGDTEAF